MNTPKRLRILVVDDDARSTRTLVKMLREDGFEAEMAIDGAAAIARLSRKPLPDILVTDIRMPHANGCAVASYARSRDPHLPIVVITSYPLETGELTQMPNPPVEVITKPLDYETLNRAIRNIAIRDAG